MNKKTKVALPASSPKVLESEVVPREHEHLGSTTHGGMRLESASRKNQKGMLRSTNESKSRDTNAI